MCCGGRANRWSPGTEKQVLHIILGGCSGLGPIARGPGMRQAAAPQLKVCGKGMADQARAKMTVGSTTTT
jgi:hypothetical protein